MTDTDFKTFARAMWPAASIVSDAVDLSYTLTWPSGIEVRATHRSIAYAKSWPQLYEWIDDQYRAAVDQRAQQLAAEASDG